MAQHHLSPEVTYSPEHGGSTKRIWVTLAWLSIITIIELGLGLWIYTIHNGANPSAGLVLFIKGVILILSLLKAYLIVAVFMHLGDEIRNFIMTIVTPLLLFVWFIIAFLLDGHSWNQMRNTNGGSRPYPKTEQVKPAAPTINEKP